MSKVNKRICILGGGFGGLYTALRLNEFSWDNSEIPEIVLIDQHDHFLFLPLLYELVTGEMQSWEIAPPFTEILADTKINFVQGQVTGIDIESQTVKLADHCEQVYDYLVIALGGTTPLDIVPGAKDFAIPFHSLHDAYHLAERLRYLENSTQDKIRVAIVGAGYSGVELACKLSDRLGERGRLRLIDRGDHILRNAPEFNQKAAKEALELKKVWLDLETQVESVTENSLSLSYKGQVDTIPVDLVLWTVGNQISEVVTSLPFKQNARGQLMTNNLLQVVDYPDIYALGDLADTKDAMGNPIPTTAQAAFQESDYCAWNIWASMMKKPLLPFRYLPLGEMMTLGADNASLTGLGINLDGPMAYLARRLIYLYRLPTLKHQLNVGLSWLTQPFVDLLS